MSDCFIIALCASYINTEARLKHFFVMLNSWINQEHMLCSMYIETSITDDSLLSKFKDMFENFKTRYAEELSGLALEVSITQKQRKQFQHYKHFVDEHTSLIKLNPWVIFTDDDDIWHPKRLVMYCSGIQKITSEKLVDIDRIHCPYYVESVGTDLHDYSTPSDIDEGIRLGNIVKSNSDLNYVNSCVRIERLYYFLTHSTDELLDCTYADTRFCYFMQSDGTERGKQSMIMTECWADGWMYFYRHVGDPQGSITNNKNKLPDCLTYSSELMEKFEGLCLQLDHKKQIVSLLNHVELSICYGCKDIHKTLVKYEKNQLERKIPAKYVMREIRPLYKIVYEFIEHSYYKNLMKHCSQ